MEIKLILLLFIAHLLSDFIFQTQSMSNKKENEVFSKYHIFHVLTVGAFSYILSLDFGFWKAAILLTILHLFTDMLKSWLILKNQSNNYFFIDQLIHILTIVIIAFLYSKISDINFIINLEIKTIAVIAGFIFCTKPSNILIRYLLVSFSIKVPSEDPDNTDELSLPNAGKLIGIVERLLALALILMGQFEAVGLIIAAKSILRFSGTQKSEYVLVGTLLSFSIAVFTGILINFLI